MLPWVTVEHIDGDASVQGVDLVDHQEEEGQNMILYYLMPIEGWYEKHFTRTQNTMFNSGFFEERKLF